MRQKALEQLAECQQVSFSHAFARLSRLCHDDGVVCVATLYIAATCSSGFTPHSVYAITFTCPFLCRFAVF